MAAPVSERLFSLELLVDWVRLEAGPPPPVVQAEEELEQEEGASPPPPSLSLCPAVAFRLLDFPTLLVYPRGGPAAPAPEPRPGLLRFGRGKSCLFRLPPATLRRRLLETPLYSLLLQLPPGRPTPAPQLLGTCSVSLAAAAREVLGPVASGCSHSHRGNFPLQNHVGERIGDISLAYRLTDLGSSLLSHLRRPIISTEGGEEGAEVGEAAAVRSQAQQEKQLRQLDSDPSPRETDRTLQSLKHPKAQKDLKETVFHSKASSGNTGPVEKDKTSSVCSDESGVASVSPPDQEVSELDIETNTFCPPPLYYTHMTQEKRPPLQGKISIKSQMHVPEELDGTFLEEKLINPATPTNLLKHSNSAAERESPAVLSSPHARDVAASNPNTSHPQPEPGRINTIRQLPLLNALLVELSLLYNQPVASPTHIHPHLAWLYRTEDEKSPEAPAKSTGKSESKKDELSMGEKEKSLSLQYKKSQVENLRKGKYFEKSNDAPQTRVPRGKLLYGLTNTLKLRLKQTNPGVLVVHEKREQYRKMQAQMLDAKLRIPFPRVKVFSFAEYHQKPHQLPKDKYLDSDTSFAKNSDSSKPISGVFDEPSTTKTELKCATEKSVNYGENRTNNGSLGETVSPANSIIQERFAHTNILEGKVEMKVQSPFVFQQVAVVDKLVIDKEIDDKQIQSTGNDILTADVSENQPSKNSCSESISEPKYSDDFTSPSYSEDFYTTEDTSRSLQAHDGSPGTEHSTCSQYTSKSSEARVRTRKNSSEKSFVLSPPFSAGSPVYSSKRSHISKTRDKSLEEASTVSTSDLSSYWTEEKENQKDQTSMHNSQVRKRGQDISIKLETRTDGKSLEKSQSTRTSQVSSYLPSNLSEHSKSDHCEEDSDEIGSLSFSKQCKDICELVINKLPGYTV